jgi:hypothetical protein
VNRAILASAWRVVVLTSVASSLHAASAGDIKKLAILRAAGKTESCEELADIAKTAADHDVREAAAKKLTDQAVLALIAKNDEHTRCTRCTRVAWVRRDSARA